jgi:flagella basal body P-ring formation protein FlgA
VLAQSVTAVRAIRSQSLIGADDVTLDDATVPGGVAELAAVVGREARVTLYPGRPILGGQIGAPALVERNQIVRMHFAQGALSIVTDGRALDRAGVGELVRVMNLASRQIVTGSVAADGSIEVGP